MCSIIVKGTKLIVHDFTENIRILDRFMGGDCLSGEKIKRTERDVGMYCKAAARGVFCRVTCVTRCLDVKCRA